jgi:hypothetical protein
MPKAIPQSNFALLNGQTYKHFKGSSTTRCWLRSRKTSNQVLLEINLINKFRKTWNIREGRELLISNTLTIRSSWIEVYSRTTFGPGTFIRGGNAEEETQLTTRPTCLCGENKVNPSVVLVILQQAKIVPKNFICVEKAGDKTEVYCYDPHIKHSPFRRKGRSIDFPRKQGTSCRRPSGSCWPFLTVGAVHQQLVESSWNVLAHGEARTGSEGETGEWSG